MCNAWCAGVFWDPDCTACFSNPPNAVHKLRNLGGIILASALLFVPASTHADSPAMIGSTHVHEDTARVPSGDWSAVVQS